MVEKIANENVGQPAVFPIAAEEFLKKGQSIRFAAAGNSMHPTLRQGDTLIVEPCNPASLAVGDIALFKDAGRLFAHRIIGIVASASKHSDLCFVLRGDFRRNTDPPITASQILGKVVAVERNHKARSPYGCGKQLFAATYRISSHLKTFLSFGQ